MRSGRTDISAEERGMTVRELRNTCLTDSGQVLVLKTVTKRLKAWADKVQEAL